MAGSDVPDTSPTAEPPPPLWYTVLKVIIVGIQLVSFVTGLVLVPVIKFCTFHCGHPNLQHFLNNCKWYGLANISIFITILPYPAGTSESSKRQIDIMKGLIIAVITYILFFLAGFTESKIETSCPESSGINL
jgi:hypothetical protein